jgi:carnosine N-methyltransferase
MLRPVFIPDVLPSSLPPGSDFSLVAGMCSVKSALRSLLSLFSGDFEEIYGAEHSDEDSQGPHSGQWDAILTCFFIDTVSL